MSQPWASPTPRTASDRILTQWKSAEARGPRSRLVDDLAYRAIWLCRAFAEREELFQDWERRVQARILETSRGTPNAPLREVTHLSVEQADRTTVRRLIQQRVPFVIDGYLKDTVAVREWSLDSLKARCGDAAVHSVRDEVEDGDDHDTWYRKHSFGWATLGDVIDRIRRGERDYVSSVGAIFKQFPELVEEAGLPEVERFSGLSFTKADLFMGSVQNKSYFHCATIDNLFLMIHGHKSWVLTHPRHSKWMYPNIGYSRLSTGSPIRSHDPDVAERYPLYAQIPKFTVHLEPGDLYYNPSWMWHEVSNLDETIGIATRILASARTPNPFFDFLLYSSPDFLRELPKLIKDRFSGRRDFAFDDTMVSKAYRHRSP